MIDILLVNTITVEHLLMILVLMEKFLEKLLLYKVGGVIKVLTNACCNEHENYPLDTYESNYTLSAPGGLETISIDKGFLGFCVANGTYEILARTSTTIYVKTYFCW